VVGSTGIDVNVSYTCFTGVMLMYNKLTNHNLFKLLSDESRQKLSQVAKVKNYQTGEFLIKENEPNEHLFLLMEGSVRIVSSDGELITILRSESVIGEISISGTASPIADAIAEGAVKVASFPIQVISNILSQETAFSDALHELGMRRVASRLFNS